MNIIKNIHKLAGIVPEDIIQKLEAGALQHQRYSNITFKIINAYADELHVRAEQGFSAAGNYANQDTLITRIRELFGITGKTIFTHPVCYQNPEAQTIDHKWIQTQMFELGIKLKTIAEETGIERSNVSGYINGERELTKPVKAMFYFYFRGKKNERQTL